MFPQIHKNKYPRHIVSGTGIDELYDKNQQELIKLKDESAHQKKELTQLRILNEKLNDRVEYLQ